MLTLTDNAIGLIRHLTARPGISDEAGLRIATGPAGGALSVGVVSGPVTGDHVLDSSGARVFLDAEAVRALGDKALDATLRDGTVTFSVTDPPQ